MTLTIPSTIDKIRMTESAMLHELLTFLEWFLGTLGAAASAGLTTYYIKVVLPESAARVQSSIQIGTAVTRLSELMDSTRKRVIDIEKQLPNSCKYNADHNHAPPDAKTALLPRHA